MKGCALNSGRWNPTESTAGVEVSARLALPGGSSCWQRTPHAVGLHCFRLRLCALVATLSSGSSPPLPPSREDL